MTSRKAVRRTVLLAVGALLPASALSAALIDCLSDVGVNVTWENGTTTTVDMHLDVESGDLGGYHANYVTSPDTGISYELRFLYDCNTYGDPLVEQWTVYPQLPGDEV